MEGADERDDLLEWEALYLRLPVHNFSWNGSEWDPAGNGTLLPNATWDGASAPFDSPAALVRAAVKAVVLGLLILATVVGKLFHLFIFLTCL